MYTAPFCEISTSRPPVEGPAAAELGMHQLGEMRF